jgi:hypothetical protein
MKPRKHSRKRRCDICHKMRVRVRTLPLCDDDGVLTGGKVVACRACQRTIPEV